MFKNSSNKISDFNWEAYWEDVCNGIDIMDQIKKRNQGEYITDALIIKNRECYEDVLDIERYNYDKKIYGKAYVEVARRKGNYKYVMAF